MLKKIQTILAAILRVDPSDITPDKDLALDLGADSLDMTEIIMALEDEFSTDIPDEHAARLTTVGEITRWLEDNT